MPDDAPPRGWPAEFARGDADRSAVLVLATLRGLTPRRLHALAWRLGSAAACLAAVRAGEAGSPADRDRARRADGDACRDLVEAARLRVVVPGGAEYVDALEDLPDPPAVLFVRGRMLVSLTPAVAVVGARRPTPLGADVAHALGAGLAAAGVCVVSGAAQGVDSASHEGALAAGGSSAAVLGCGVDRVPRRCAALLERLEEDGAVVGEYPPGTQAERWHYPARNRIVAALASGVIIVEGREGSGSLITTDHALALGRDVFAVPGPITSPLSAAPHGLIREGATLVRGVDDVLDDLGWRRSAASASPPLEGDELAVFRNIAGPTLVESLARDASLSVPRIRAALTSLELKGLVRGVAGRFERRMR